MDDVAQGGPFGVAVAAEEASGAGAAHAYGGEVEYFTSKYGL